MSANTKRIIVSNVPSYGTGAQLAASLNAGGGVGSISVVSGGSGYYVPPLLYITGGGGSGAVFTPVIVNGTITSTVSIASGSGYTSAPTVLVLPSSVSMAASSGYQFYTCPNTVNSTIVYSLTLCNKDGVSQAGHSVCVLLNTASGVVYIAYEVGIPYGTTLCTKLDLSLVLEPGDILILAADMPGVIDATINYAER